MTSWLSTQPTSHWQQGCNDGKAGKPRREPGQPGIADMANVGYMNGWHFGRQQRLKEQTACGVPAFDAAKPCVLTTADPTRTYCERCKNPHHACDHAAGVDLPDGGQRGA